MTVWDPDSWVPTSFCCDIQQKDSEGSSYKVALYHEIQETHWEGSCQNFLYPLYIRNIFIICTYLCIKNQFHNYPSLASWETCQIWVKHIPNCQFQELTSNNKSGMSKLDKAALSSCSCKSVIFVMSATSVSNPNPTAFATLYASSSCRLRFAIVIHEWWKRGKYLESTS